MLQRFRRQSVEKGVQQPQPDTHRMLGCSALHLNNPYREDLIANGAPVSRTFLVLSHWRPADSEALPALHRELVLGAQQHALVDEAFAQEEIARMEASVSGGQQEAIYALTSGMIDLVAQHRSELEQKALLAAQNRELKQLEA